LITARHGGALKIFRFFRSLKILFISNITVYRCHVSLVNDFDIRLHEEFSRSYFTTIAGLKTGGYLTVLFISSFSSIDDLTLKMLVIIILHLQLHFITRIFCLLYFCINPRYFCVLCLFAVVNFFLFLAGINKSTLTATTLLCLKMAMNTQQQIIIWANWSTTLVLVRQ
jgi:hypothetical protein